jgi:hypothetical protein
MQTLYEIKSGKFDRKDHNGNRIVLKQGDKFVPSPSELKSDQHRLVPAGQVDDESLEVMAAKQNTNFKDYPSAFGGPLPSQFDAPADIREVKSTEEALQLVAMISDLNIVNTYLDQEVQNKPRVRKVVVDALNKRRVQVAPGAGNLS